MFGERGSVRDLIEFRKSEYCGENMNCDYKILLYFNSKSTSFLEGQILTASL